MTQYLKKKKKSKDLHELSIKKQKKEFTLGHPGDNYLGFGLCAVHFAFPSFSLLSRIVDNSLLSNTFLANGYTPLVLLNQE